MDNNFYKNILNKLENNLPLTPEEFQVIQFVRDVKRMGLDVEVVNVGQPMDTPRSIPTKNTVTVKSEWTMANGTVAYYEYKNPTPGFDSWELFMQETYLRTKHGLGNHDVLKGITILE